MVYELETWVMAHSAGVDVVLGTNFMILAGVRLNLFLGAAQLPNEIRIPLVKTKNMLDSEEFGSHVNGGPSEQLDIPGHEWREYRLWKRQEALETHVLWIRRTEKIIPSVTRFRSTAADQANQRLRPDGVLPGARRHSSVGSSR
ncbi:hypothetical protein PI125_g22758 [Phytophthora idaei]|nr:hypothetical protein PI125_g22758 [Phytophthora idaei]